MNSKVRKVIAYILIILVLVVTIIALLAIWGIIDNLNEVLARLFGSLLAIFVGTAVILFIHSVLNKD